MCRICGGKSLHQRCTHTQSTAGSHGELAGRWEGPRRAGTCWKQQAESGTATHSCRQAVNQDAWSRYREQIKGERNRRDAEAGSPLAPPAIAVILGQWQFPPKFFFLQDTRFSRQSILFHPSTQHGSQGYCFPELQQLPCPATWLLCPALPLYAYSSLLPALKAALPQWPVKDHLSCL